MKLKKYTSPAYTKKKLTPLKIVQKFADTINMIICFGPSPYQLLYIMESFQSLNFRPNLA